MARNDRGFTVVELLVTVTIVMAIAVFVGVAINLGRQYVSRTTEMLAAAEDISLLRRVISEPLENVFFDGRNPAITGTAQDLIVRIPESRAPALPGPVTFTVTSGVDQIQASWRSDSQSGQPVTHPLIERAHDLSFSYFSTDTGWLDAWIRSDQIPRLIRLTFRDSIGNVVDLVLPVQAVQSVECAIRPANKLCQAN